MRPIETLGEFDNFIEMVLQQLSHHVPTSVFVSELTAFCAAVRGAVCLEWDINSDEFARRMKSNPNSPLGVQILIHVRKLEAFVREYSRERQQEIRDRNGGML